MVNYADGKKKRVKNVKVARKIQKRVDEKC